MAFEALPVEEPEHVEAPEALAEQSSSAISVDELPEFDEQRRVWISNLYTASGAHVQVDASRIVPRLRKLSPGTYDTCKLRLDKAERRAIADEYKRLRKQSKKKQNSSKNKNAKSKGQQSPAPAAPCAAPSVRSGGQSVLHSHAKGGHHVESDGDDAECNLPEQATAVGAHNMQTDSGVSHTTGVVEAACEPQTLQQPKQYAPMGTWLDAHLMFGTNFRSQLPESESASGRGEHSSVGIRGCSERLLRSTFAQVLQDPVLRSEARRLLRPAPPPGFEAATED